jgi:hypothetical protein
MDDDDDDDVEIVDVIYEDEQVTPTELVHGQRYLGVDDHEQRHILLNTVQAKTFFKHTFTDIVHYLYVYSIAKPSLPPRILQLSVLDDDTYAVCDKTIWLRIVQRRWKRVLRDRQIYIRNYNVVKRQLRGGVTLRGVPQLYGMLAILLPNALTEGYTRIGIDSHLPTSRPECSASRNHA